MRRLVIISLLVWGAAAPLWAQQIQGPFGIDALDEAATFKVPANVPSVAIQIVGTFTGTIIFECQSNAITWVAVAATNASTTATTTTAAGIFSIANSGYTACRARMSAYTNGGANVTMTQGAGVNPSFSVGDVTLDAAMGAGSTSSTTLRTVEADDSLVVSSLGILNQGQDGTTKRYQSDIVTLPSGPNTGDAITATPDTSSSTEIFAANTSGKGWMCANTSTVSLFIAYTVTAAVATAPIEVLPNQMWVDPFGFIGSVKGIWGTRAGASDPGTGSSLCQGVQ